LVTTTSVTEPDAVDGRRLRGQRTRLKVIESLLDLVAQGNVRPTAQEIAQHAGVALRTVYHHFEDVEALRRLALELDMNRHAEILEPVDTSLPLAERIETIASQCRRLFEAVTPIRRATLFDQHSSPEMASGIAVATATRSAHVIAAFAPELNRHGGSGEVTDAVVLATSWVAWEYLRTMLHRPASVAEQIVITTLSRLLPSDSAGSGNGAGARS
jgi:TetR/AcrR family transcriptional regulator of autoinduction and epiphytic fitness